MFSSEIYYKYFKNSFKIKNVYLLIEFDIFTYLFTNIIKYKSLQI